MRRLVPFVGEKQIARPDTDQERAKRAAGRVIDEVVSTADGESSWDDLVPNDWPSKPLTPKPPTGAGVTRPAKVGFSPGSPRASQSLTRTTTLVYSDKPTLEWISINNGRSLRISIQGNIDHELRPEWQRLLDETQDVAAAEFEFNLAHAGALSLTGLGMLLLFKERKGSSREAITLFNCNKEVAQLLHWTGMDKYFVIQAVSAPDA